MQKQCVLFAVSLLGSVAFAQSPQILPLPQIGATQTNHPVVVGDFDGDGIPDLAFPGIVPTSAGVTLRRGVGLGFLREVETTTLTSGCPTIGAGDVDGDGKDDLFGANASTGKVFVLRDFEAPSFASVTELSIPAAGFVSALVAGGDFDGDGDLDFVVVAMANNAPFHVFLGDGAGGFTGPLSGPIANVPPNSLCVGDFNEDGRSDLAWQQHDTFLRVTFGQVGGSLGAPVAINTGHTLWRVRTGDADENGHEDVLCSIYDFPPVYGVVLALGDGSGNLVPGALMTATTVEAYTWSAVDLDVDGTTDLVGESGAYFRGLGAGSFAAMQQLEAPKLFPGDPRFDVNQDGTPDFLSKYFSSITLVLSTGPLQYPTYLPTALDGRTAGLASGDFDEDGKQDLIVGDQEFSRIYLLHGNGAGGFVSPLILGSMSKPLTIASGDFNADGNLDFAAASWNLAVVNVYLGNGAGGFSLAPSFGLAGPPNEMIAEDLNGDGRIDLAAACGTGMEADIALGLGNGSFTPLQSFDLVPGNGSYGLCSLNANGDPWLDLAFTLNPANQVRILLGSASGSFTLGPTIAVGSAPLRVGAGDMDADGDDDLIVAGQRGGVFLGNGAASFVAKSELGDGASPPWLDASVVDFDGDGFMDVVGLAGSGAVFFARGNGRAEFGQLHWFASTGSMGEEATFALADFTGDGLKDFARPTNISIYCVSVVPHLESADLPIAYCEPKASSNGCVPQIAWEGMPSASATSGFVIRASPALNQKPGLIIYSLFGPASQTLGGGTLCVSSPLRRSAATNSGGNALPAVDCSGAFSLDFASFAHGLLGGTPAPELLVPGTSVAGQWFGRDPGFAPPNNLMLSNALLWTVFP